ncbi:hypothetical protein HN51_032193 [Arachis hypogaea]
MADNNAFDGATWMTQAWTTRVTTCRRGLASWVDPAMAASQRMGSRWCSAMQTCSEDKVCGSGDGCVQQESRDEGQWWGAKRMLRDITANAMVIDGQRH